LYTASVRASKDHCLLDAKNFERSDAAVAAVAPGSMDREQIPRFGPVRVALLIALLQTRTVSPQNDNFGPTAGWHWKPGSAVNIALPMGR
jgi:hypothetical protein